ncbi:hypothetical protein MKW92_039616 [Papaver armeniacum]|nr:hypothetical protein MKW92_039616 [Papaver armeniacum]
MLSEFLSCILLISLLTFSSVRSADGFDCKSTSKCISLAGYVSPKATTLLTISDLFGITDFDYFLGANSLPIGTSPSKSVSENETIKIPFTCSCKNGAGISDKIPLYKVKTGESLDRIAMDIFSSLTTSDEIAAVNNNSSYYYSDNIEIVSLWIPLTCSCDAVDGNQVFHYAHKVSPNETLEMIGKKFGVKEETLLTLNKLDGAAELVIDSVLDVPLRG